MNISNEVNIDVLNEVYALSAFHGLRTAHANDQWDEEMTEEAEGYLPNSDAYTHDGEVSHDDQNAHLKVNSTLEAMQRATEKKGSVELPRQASINGEASKGTDKNNNNNNNSNTQTKPIQGQLDHDSLAISDYTTTPQNQSMDNLTSAHRFVDFNYINFDKNININIE